MTEDPDNSAASQSGFPLSILKKHPVSGWLLLGLLLFGIFLTIPYIPDNIEKESLSEGWFLVKVIGLLLIACMSYYFIFLLLPKTPRKFHKIILLWIVLIGILCRGFLSFTTTPIEDDFYRYLWDGGVLAHGENPYAFAPKEILEGTGDETILRLTNEQSHILQKINHPHLRSIYPPVTQAFFTFCHFIKPFSLSGLRIGYFLLEIITILILFILLKYFKRNSLYLSVFIWNPLLIYETYYKCHFDFIVGTFLLIFLLGLLHQSRWLIITGLTLAVGFKLWPILLSPILLLNKHQALKTKIITCLLCAGALLPILVIYSNSMNHSNSSGTVKYSKEWQANEFAYLPFHGAGWAISKSIEGKIDGRVIARCTIILLLLISTFILARFILYHPENILVYFTTIILLMLLMSPTLYPWYYLALIPCAVLLPSKLSLVWTGLLPLTYLKWIVPDQWEIIVMAIIHLPVWIFWTMTIRQYYFQQPTESANV